ncbi:cysteine-rich protein 2-binding protein-like isoform X2 [Styela clava]|uniref:cysteine-rich protein 2-binding protein-like isoform X2 n=1 Tax=Styela clava TaxID=7725 RepID=UPI00193A0045|nr:cysteine-rich protein 2-binding protein-like isoform X2 [Styela clava]
MSDQEQIDVTTTEDATEPSTKTTSSRCGYCDCEKEGLPVFHCSSCAKWVHTSCLRSESPSPLLFDNYYVFKCISCSEDGKESFIRMRITWNQATALSLFNMAQSDPGKQGFFKWKEDICDFVETHWDVLFESYRMKVGAWMNTIASTMSAGNPHQFTSGYGFFKESGWWKLTDPTKPPEYTPSSDSRFREGRSKKFKSGSAMTPSPSLGRTEGLRKRSYLSSAFNASQIKEKRAKTQNNEEIRKIEFLKDCLKSDTSCDSTSSQICNETMQTSKTPAKSGKIEDVDESKKNSSPVPEDSPPSFKGCGSPLSSPLSSPRSLSVTSMLSKGDIMPDNTLPLSILSDDSDLELDKTKNKRPETPEKYFTPLPASSATSTPQPSSPNTEVNDNPILLDSFSTCQHSTEYDLSNIQSAFSAVSKRKFITVGAVKKTTSDVPKLQEMSLYEERELLKILESYGSLLKELPEAYRLRRKLIVRQKKRELNIPIVSFDATVHRLVAQKQGIKLPEENKTTPIGYAVGIVPNTMLSSPHHRILDRFQMSGTIINSEVHQKRTFRQKLIGCDEVLQPIVSPYTQRVLKPYIRRDYESKPPKLALMEELVAKYNEKLKQSNTETPAPIDYCYVGPHHIPTINSMCHHFFWPGIDVSETLQYPDFSIVASYKKMVIGFGFMVPDVNFNEAYISFLLVHPDWQHCGIGTFMTYHLIQTCLVKEITLHVSASNSAMLLYQKFGFKPEKFISDFYDKYYPIDTEECTHAFFMRLRR